MRFEKIDIIDYGEMYSTYHSFIAENNLNDKFFYFGADGLPPKDGYFPISITDFTEEGEFHSYVEEANGDFCDLVHYDKDLFIKYRNDWLYYAGPLDHSSQEDKLFVIMKSFNGRNNILPEYTGIIKLLIGQDGVKFQDNFIGYSDIWNEVW